MSVVINGSAGVTTNSGAVYNGISAGTAVASTSGTSIDFTGIPSWVKRVTVMINGLSSSGTSHFLLQIGAGSVQTTGYTGAAGFAGGANAAQGTSQTIGAPIFNQNASYAYYGSVTITSMGSNLWCFSGAVCTPGYPALGSMGATVTLSGTLDRVRLTTVNGTDTFDAGSINILYE